MLKTDVILIRNANQFDFGGAEKYQILLAKELLKHNIGPLIITAHQQILQSAHQNQLPHFKAPWLKWQNFSGWRIIFIPLYFLWQGWLSLHYWRLFKKLQPQVVHLQSRDDFIAGTIAAKKIGARVIWTDHADLKHLFLNIDKPFKNPIGKTILKLIKKVDSIILVSNGEKEMIKQHLKSSHLFWQKVQIIHNGSLDNFQTHRHQTEFIFGMVCRIVKDKGVKEAIKAFEFINQKNPNSQLWIVGDGPDLDLFQSSTNNTCIKFFGYQDQPLDLMAKFNCFLQPTYHEALSLSLVEACMMKLPIITTQIGGNPEVIEDQKSGLLVEPQHVEQLQQAMLKIMSDPKFAQQLACNARKTFEQKFNFAKIVQDQIIPLYFPKNDKIES